MSPRRSRRLAGLSPEVLDDMPVKSMNVQKELVTAGFFGTLFSIVVLSGAVVFALWK